MIDINARFNVCSTIKYYNIIHNKGNIYEAEGKGNYFRLVTLKIVHPNDREIVPMILRKLWISSMFWMTMIVM